MKKISALVVAVVMLLAMGTIAFAETTNTKETQSDTLSFSTTGVSIPKDIVIYNTDGSIIYEPNVTYTYSLTNGEAGSYVQDAAGNQANVKAGITGGLLIKGNQESSTAGQTAVIEFGVDAALGEIAASTEGTVVASAAKFTKNITATFDTSVFKSGDNYLPGIYRYVLTETANTISTSGVTRATNYTTAYYLDVYTKWNSDKTALEVYGLTMFKADNCTSVKHR